MKHENEECHEEEECFAVKGCKKGRPVKVRLEEDCDPIPVHLEEVHCPIPVTIENCEPLQVKQEKGHCWRVQGCKEGDPVVIAPRPDDCWMVQGCEDGVPVNVNIVNQQPPPPANVNQTVFNGVSWEPVLTPSRFVTLDNVQINGSGPVWTSAAGLRFRLMGFFLTSSLAGQVNFRDGVGGPIIVSQVVVAGVPFSPPPLGNGIKSIAIGNPLVIEVFAGPGTFANITGLITGQETL